MNDRRMGRTGRIIGTILVLVIAATCIRLGIWQLSRLDEKRTRNAALSARMAAAPALLDASMTDTAGVVYRRATVRGFYDDERAIVLPGRSHRGQPGVLLLTPLRMGGVAILVQRGWVPSPDAVSIDLSAFQTDTAVTVHGLVLPFLGEANTLATRATGTAAADTFRRVWYAIDPEELRAQFPYPLLPLRLQQLPDTSRTTTASPYPLAQAAPLLEEGPHLGYAVQWFSFALIFLVGWAALLRSGRNRRG